MLWGGSFRAKRILPVIYEVGCHSLLWISNEGSKHNVKESFDRYRSVQTAFTHHIRCQHEHLTRKILSTIIRSIGRHRLHLLSWMKITNVTAIAFSIVLSTSTSIFPSDKVVYFLHPCLSFFYCIFVLQCPKDVQTSPKKIKW